MGIDGGFGCDGWVWFGAANDLKTKGRKTGVSPRSSVWIEHATSGFLNNDGKLADSDLWQVKTAMGAFAVSGIG